MLLASLLLLLHKRPPLLLRGGLVVVLQNVRAFLAEGFGLAYGAYQGRHNPEEFAWLLDVFVVADHLHYLDEQPDCFAQENTLVKVRLSYDLLPLFEEGHLCLILLGQPAFYLFSQAFTLFVLYLNLALEFF